MTTQSFDVSLGDKTLTWQAPRQAPPRPAPPWPVPPRPAWRAPPGPPAKPEPREPEPREPEPRPARACPAARHGVECQACTLAALVVLAATHLVLLQNATALVVSAYVLVMSPLLSTFYHLPSGAPAHLYALNLTAVVVLLANVRFQRDVSAAFFAVVAAVFLHLVAGAPPCGAADSDENAPAAGAPLGQEPASSAAATCFSARTCAASLPALAARAAPAAALNAVAAYFFALHADAEYNPRLHGLQALLLALDAVVYAWARAPRPSAARAAAARSCA